MLRKFLLASIILFAILSVVFFLWVRAVFTQDTVRAALSAQLSKALGQPVTIAGIAATIYPRVTVNLEHVNIGSPAAIQVQTLHLGTDLGALFSRRIEHARVELSGAHVELPLPTFAISGSTASDTTGASSGSVVTLGSIDAIVLRRAEIVSGGRTVVADIELAPDGHAVTLTKFSLLAGKAAIDVTGRIADVAGPVGDLTIQARTLDFDQLLAFATDFAGGSGMTASPGTANTSPRRPSNARTAPGSPAMNIGLAVSADRALLGGLTLDKLAGRAHLTADTLTFDPIGFGVFGGRYDGALTFTLGEVPGFRLNADVKQLEMNEITAWGGSPGTITGRLSGRLNLTGTGADATSVINQARGTARIEIIDGIVKNLALVRTIVVATSGRADRSSADLGEKDEPFTRIGATLAIGGGSARTHDLRFESKDLTVDGDGSVRLDGRAIDLAGKVQLSDQLTQRAGRDLVRYTQEGGRVTLPATITGSAAAPQVRVDVAAMAKRAVVNRGAEEAQKVLKKGLGRIFKK